MNVSFFDTEDGANRLNGQVITDWKQLIGILEELRTREPFVCKLTGDNGFELDVGIGKKGCVQYGRTDGLPPYLMAVAPFLEDSEGETEFLMTGTPTPMSNRYCMPFDKVQEIVGYFARSGSAHPDFIWEEI